MCVRVCVHVYVGMFLLVSVLSPSRRLALTLRCVNDISMCMCVCVCVCVWSNKHFSGGAKDSACDLEVMLVNNAWCLPLDVALEVFRT